MANLYELMGDYAALQHAIEEGEEEQALLDRVEEAKGTLREKVDNICRLMSNLESEAERFKLEEQRLAARRKTREKGVERLREWVRTSMGLLDVRKIKTDLYSVSVQDGQPVVIVVDAKLVPEQYLRVAEPEVDKHGVMRTYKENGEIVPGCDIVPGKAKLVIR